MLQAKIKNLFVGRARKLKAKGLWPYRPTTTTKASEEEEKDSIENENFSDYTEEKENNEDFIYKDINDLLTNPLKLQESNKIISQSNSEQSEQADLNISNTPNKRKVLSSLNQNSAKKVKTVDSSIPFKSVEYPKGEVPSFKSTANSVVKVEQSQFPPIKITKNLVRVFNNPKASNPMKAPIQVPTIKSEMSPTMAIKSSITKDSVNISKPNTRSKKKS